MTPAGIAHLKIDEGLRLHAYPDPLSGGDPYTVGYGCTGKDREGNKITSHTVWTLDQAEAELTHRIAGFEAEVSHAFPWWAALNPVRRDAVVNLAFNLGVDGLRKWPVTLSHLKDGLFNQAADDILNNKKWRAQVHDRADRVAAAIRTGVWA